MRPNQQKLVTDWNVNVRVGASVVYWTGAREGDGTKGETRTNAQLLSGHTAVVWVTGHVGCIALSHVQVVSC